MMNKYLCIFLMVCVLLSCNRRRVVTEFYKNGYPKVTYLYERNIKQDSSIHYYENYRNVIKTIKFWKDDHAYYQKDFFENGKLQREGGLLKDNFRIGKWNLYSINGYKSEVIEYMDINNASYGNQGWKLNGVGDTILGGNFYRLLHFPDTLSYNQAGRVHFFLEQRVLDGELFVCLPKEGEKLMQDFSNEYEVSWDTINNIFREFKNDPKYENAKYDVIFSLSSDKEGVNALRGYLLELEDVRCLDTLDFITRKIYFDIPYYVRELD